jgi:hypothetical protein
MHIFGGKPAKTHFEMYDVWEKKSSLMFAGNAF